jgi:hypothetical protein
VEGDFDAAVQAMHDHLRRSVLPARKQERACRVQYSATGDQGYLANRVGDTAGMNETNIHANIDIAAAPASSSLVNRRFISSTAASTSL